MARAVKINLQTDAEVTYLLTTGGHNVGIVSEPGHDGHSFQVSTKKHDDRYLDPEAFLASAPRKEGSWWPEWVAWLEERSGAPVNPNQLPPGRPTTRHCSIHREHTYFRTEFNNGC